MKDRIWKLSVKLIIVKTFWIELALQLAYKVSKKYIYNNISHIKKRDLKIRSWKLKAWRWVDHFILKTMIRSKQIFSNKAGKDCSLIYLFLTNLLKKKPVLFNIPVVWLIKPTVRNWNRTFSEKQREMQIPIVRKT